MTSRSTTGISSPSANDRSRPLWQWTASEIVSATHSGALTCAQVIASVVERMRAVNGELNAVTLDLGDAAMEAATAIDARRKSGEAPGVLFGVPVTVKDNVDVRGQRTPNGVTGLKELIAPAHSPVVKHLLDAGAILVGRTNTPEFSMRATTNNALYGLTRNPWDARVSCGGSSGGAGVAVAAGMCAIGHGNDIGGSIRFPALHCGVAGLKPTLGRIPAYLPSSVAERPFVSSMMSVQGPLARSVADLRLALGTMAARDPRDPWWSPAPLEGPAVAKRAGMVESIAGLPYSPGVAHGMRAAADALAKAGYDVQPVEVPDIARSGELSLRLLTTDMQAQMLPAAKRMGSEEIKWYFDAWFAAVTPYATVAEYLDAMAERNTLLRKWLLALDACPVILMPQRTGPLLQVDEDLRDAAHLADLLHSFAPSATLNLMGLPSVMVPTGLYEGLPTGVQLVSSRYREDVCLAAGEAVEHALGTLSRQLWQREGAGG